MSDVLNNRPLRTKSISQAHRWTRKLRLFGRLKPRVEVWELQIAISAVLWMEPVRAVRINLDDPDEDSPSVDAVEFPDKSFIWFCSDSDMWGVTDPDGIDSSEQFVIESV